MKKVLLAIIALAVTTNAFSQNTNPWPSTGPVGIGTASPTNLLTVSGGGTSSNILVKNTSPNYYPYFISENDLGVQSTFSTGRSGHASVTGKTVISNANGNPILMDPFNIGSNFAVGSYAPTARFMVKGKAGTDDVMALWSSTNAQIFTVNSYGATTVSATALPSRENVIKATTSDGGADALLIANGTSNNSSFVPTVAGFLNTINTLSALNINGFVTSANDVGTAGVVSFNSSVTSSTTDPINGTFSAVTNRPLFQFNNRSLSNKNVMTMMPNGNIGIGSVNPQSPLTIRGNSNWGSVKIMPNVNDQETAISFSSRASETDNSNLWILGYGAWQAGSSFTVGHSSLGAPSMTFATNGNIGIGTIQVPSQYKLAVNGAAIATSMTVKLYSVWPDFVFKKNYKLPTLDEVKSYIDKNQHLPDMPSANEVHANGLDLGEMNRLLLKKVEELTLYLLQKDEQIKTQEERLKKLEDLILKKGDTQ